MTGKRVFLLSFLLFPSLSFLSISLLFSPSLSFLWISRSYFFHLYFMTTFWIGIYFLLLLSRIESHSSESSSSIPLSSLTEFLKTRERREKYHWISLSLSPQFYFMFLEIFRMVTLLEKVLQIITRIEEKEESSTQNKEEKEREGMK